MKITVKSIENKKEDSFKAQDGADIKFCEYDIHAYREDIDKEAPIVIKAFGDRNMALVTIGAELDVEEKTFKGQVWYKVTSQKKEYKEYKKEEVKKISFDLYRGLVQDSWNLALELAVKEIRTDGNVIFPSRLELSAEEGKTTKDLACQLFIKILGCASVMVDYKPAVEFSVDTDINNIPF